MAEHTLTTAWTKITRVIPAHFPREPSTTRSPGDRLSIVLDDFKTNEHVHPNALTLVLTHGTSFNRLFWELVLADLLPPLNRIIRRVITIDAVNHGDSAVHNADKLGTSGCWPDISRDILDTLDILDVQDPVVGIGHSFGGGALLHAAMMAASRFAATILVEPILFQMKGPTRAIAQIALRRRDRWQTLEEVRASFGKAFNGWHPSQLDRYINDGTYFMKEDGKQGYFTLKTPKLQEAATYLAAPYPRILQLLAQSSQRHYFIFGEQSKVINKKNRQRVEALSQRPGSVQIFADAGHLIPMTHPHTLSAMLRCQLEEVHGIIDKGSQSESKL